MLVFYLIEIIIFLIEPFVYYSPPAHRDIQNMGYSVSADFHLRRADLADLGCII